MPELGDFVAKCDWTGALTLLDFQRRANDEDESTLPWLAYCAFHMGDYDKALETYDEIEMVMFCVSGSSVPSLALPLATRWCKRAAFG
jgi:intraflagellar transport protein 56